VEVGGLYRPITVSIDPNVLATLAPKVYTANITVAAPTATNKSATYPITLSVHASPPMITDLQVRVTVPGAATPGSTVPLTVRVDRGTGAVAAQTGVTLALK